MYISVIPTSKSQGKKPYLYFVNQTWEAQISLGGVVEVPFGNNIILGIIASIEQSYDREFIHEIRPIHSVISQTPLLSRELLSVVLDLSERYFLPIHKALALFLPAPLFHRLEKRNYILDTLCSKKMGNKTQSSVTVKHAIHHIFTPKDLDEYLLPNTVIIFPDDVMLYTFMDKKKVEKNTLLLPTESTNTKRIQGWIDIYEGKYEIIVGTRRLLYYNLSAYSHIIYIEDAFGSEQFQYPISIRSLDVLSSLAHSKTFDITILSSSPTLELFAKFPKTKIVPIK